MYCPPMETRLNDRKDEINFLLKIAIENILGLKRYPPSKIEEKMNYEAGSSKISTPKQISTSLNLIWCPYPKCAHV